MSSARHKRFAEEPFIITAHLSLVVAAAWIAFHPRLLIDFFYSPHSLALTHIFTLGFLTSLIMGILLRLVPMTLGVEPRSARLAIAQFAIFFVGWTGMVAHFWLDEPMEMAWATLLVIAAGIMQLVNFAEVFRKALDGDWVARYVAAGLVHFVLAGLLGATYGMQNVYGFASSILTAPTLVKLSAHFHLAAVGWGTTMIFGFQMKLVPTTRGTDRQIALRFFLLQAGLAGLLVSLLVELPTTPIFAGMIALATILQAVGPLRKIAIRRDWLWETVGLGLLVALAVVGCLLSLGIPEPSSLLRQRVQFAYGYTALFGWFPLTIAAVSTKIFPLWVWHERFAADVGKRPVPSVPELTSPRLRALSCSALAIGTLATAAGIVAQNEMLLTVSLKVVLLGVLVHIVNFVRTARWALFNLDYTPPT